MNPKLMFWTYVWGLTLVAVLIAIKGIFKAKNGELESHQKHMDWSIRLILFFVLSYGAKLLFLGREDLREWATSYVVVLRIHEGFIALMLFFGVNARLLARKFSARLHEPTAQDLALRIKHRRYGQWCMAAALLGLMTASYLVFGMFKRSGVL